ncbi:DUF1236 domain-containing protein [Flaviflagellibacter deserti]|uniref:DUF1236 domain-containing protein n=1 Tax=Flaviflagellibacter deserti TaxID=2267266 RepID=A0ABV9YWR2_9HYPH
MKQMVLATAMTLMAGAALAQTVIVSPEERTQIRQYVVKQKVTAVPADVSLSVGTVVPETVELHTIEGVPSATKYRYVSVGGRTALVDPGTRKVVEIID